MTEAQKIIDWAAHEANARNGFDLPAKVAVELFEHLKALSDSVYDANCYATDAKQDEAAALSDLAEARAELAKADKRWRDIVDEQPKEGRLVDNRISDHRVERGIAENRKGVWAIKGSGAMSRWRPVPSTEATGHD